MTSVIIRTLGRARLGEALASLAAQTHPDVEAGVVDMSGGSAVAALRAYPGRLKHLEIGRPLNRAVALNRGIEAAKGEVLTILDDDNLYAPDHLATLAQGLQSTGADLVYTGVTRQTLTPDGVLVEEKRMEHDYDFQRLVFANYIYASSVAFTLNIWSRVGGYDHRFPVFEDRDFYIRVGSCGRIAHIPGFGGITRNFTGKPGVPNFASETADIRRCRAGINWKHRKLLAKDRPDLYKEFPHVAPRGVRLETLPALAAWWLRGV